MTDERVTEARKALSRYEDRNSRPNPAHLADAVRGLLVIIDEALTPTDDERKALREQIAYRVQTAVAYGKGVQKWGQLSERTQDAWIDEQVALAMNSRAVSGFRHSEVPEPSAEECQNNFCTRGATVCGTCSWRRDAEPQGEPSDAGVGWFEWFKMPENTTEIAYVHESGEVFDPVRGWNPVEFTIASAEGRVFRLMRAGGVR